MQRTRIDPSVINVAAAKECYYVNSASITPICGVDGPIPPTIPNIVVRARSNYTFIFQKNLDHWSATAPSYFGVFLIDALYPTQVNYLSMVPDNNSPSLTIYTSTVTIPEVSMVHAYVGVIYFGAGITFYQCSDVMIE
jgi:hypothetical protein